MKNVSKMYKREGQRISVRQVASDDQGKFASPFVGECLRCVYMKTASK